MGRNVEIAYQLLSSMDAMRNILLPRFDTFGDIVLLEGFVESLAKIPSVERITLLVRDGYDDLISLFPESVNWLTTDLHPYNELKSSDQVKVDNLLDLLDRHKFDTVLVTTYNRTWIDEFVAAHFSGKAQRIALGGVTPSYSCGDEVHFRPGMSTGNLYDWVVPVEEATSEINKYQALADALFTGGWRIPIPQLSIPTPVLDHIPELLKSLGLCAGGYFVCVVTCTVSVPFKSWSVENFITLMEWVQADMGLRPLLLGHYSEQEKVERVAQTARNQKLDPVIWLGKNGELATLAGLIQKSRFYLGNDTGPMHIATALGVPTVGIFGGGHWPRFLPVGERAVGIAAELPCFGCNWGDCIFGDAPCVKLVTVEDVKNAIKVILSDVPIFSNYFPASSDDKTRFKHLYDICLENKSAELKRLESNNAELVGKLTQFYSSLSWRLTKPLRWLGDRIRELGTGNREL